MEEGTSRVVFRAVSYSILSRSVDRSEELMRFGAELDVDVRDLVDVVHSGCAHPDCARQGPYGLPKSLA